MRNTAQQWNVPCRQRRLTGEWSCVHEYASEVLLSLLADCTANETSRHQQRLPRKHRTINCSCIDSPAAWFIHISPNGSISCEGTKFVCTATMHLFSVPGCQPFYTSDTNAKQAMHREGETRWVQRVALGSWGSCPTTPRDWVRGTQPEKAGKTWCSGGEWKPRCLCLVGDEKNHWYT